METKHNIGGAVWQWDASSKLYDAYLLFQPHCCISVRPCDFTGRKCQKSASETVVHGALSKSTPCSSVFCRL